jgi:hypothetical protein
VEGIICVEVGCRVEVTVGVGGMGVLVFPAVGISVGKATGGITGKPAW